MEFHRNAKLGLAGRLALVQAIERGMSLKAAAAAFSVPPATAYARVTHGSGLAFAQISWGKVCSNARPDPGCASHRSLRSP